MTKKILVASITATIMSTFMIPAYNLSQRQPIINSLVAKAELKIGRVENKPMTAKLNSEKEIQIKKVKQEDIDLLARLIQSESLDEPYEGKIWVGAVVINRMRIFNQSLQEVIFKRGQFDGVNTKLFNIKPSNDCVLAAEQVLNGILPSKEVLYFVDLQLCNPSWVNDTKFVIKINRHTFYEEVKK